MKKIIFLTGLFFMVLASYGQLPTGGSYTLNPRTGKFDIYVGSDSAYQSITADTVYFSGDSTYAYGDGDTIRFFVDGTEAMRLFDNGGSTQILIVAGSNTVPSIGILGDENTGIYSPSDGVLRLTINGTAEWYISGQQLTSLNGAGILDEGPTTTNPVFILNSSKETTGIGGDDDTSVSVISAGVEILNVNGGGIVVSGIMSATGNITGSMSVTLDTASTISLSASDCLNATRINNDADPIDYTLAAAAAGLIVLFYDIGGGIITLDPVDGTDTIYKNGSSVGAGHAIDSPGNVGDFVALMAIDDTRWITIGMSGKWVDGGAD